MFYNAGTFFYAFSAFFNPIRASLTLSATAVAAAFSMRSLEGGIMSPAVGFVVDRAGPRKMILFGSLIAGLSMMWLSRADSLLTFYTPFILLSLGTSFSSGIVGMATISRWFVRRRGLALGVYASGAGLGGLLVPVMIWLIDRYDWRNTLIITGVGFCILGVLVALVVRQRPEQMGLLPDGDHSGEGISSTKAQGTEEVNFSVSQALRTRTFWLLSISIMAAAMAPQALATVQIPYLESVKIDETLAGFVISAMTVISVLGRMAFGWLADFKDKSYIMAVALGLEALGLFLLASIVAPWMLFLFLATYAPAYGGVISMRPAIVADYYGRKAVGSIQGTLWSIMTVGGVVSPLLVAWIFENWGSYRPAFYILAILTALATPLMFLARRPPRPSSRVASA